MNYIKAMFYAIKWKLKSLKRVERYKLERNKNGTMTVMEREPTKTTFKWVIRQMVWMLSSKEPRAIALGSSYKAIGIMTVYNEIK